MTEKDAVKLMLAKLRVFDSENPIHLLAMTPQLICQHILNDYNDHRFGDLADALLAHRNTLCKHAEEAVRAMAQWTYLEGAFEAYRRQLDATAQDESGAAQDSNQTSTGSSRGGHEPTGNQGHT